MAFLNNIIDGMAVAKVKLSETATVISEKNKKLSQMRKLRGIIKKENQIMSQAYESLGKIIFDKMTEKEKLEYKSFCNVIEDCQETIEKARITYLAIERDTTPADIQKIKKERSANEEVTVACSNEDEYKEKIVSPEEEVADQDLF